ncbi:MAG: hypothetical protein M3Z85_08235 [Acidobacteriota bacterium]|nr:hypothetical protein [Acidobacteriota bacterium]
MFQFDHDKFVHRFRDLFGPLAEAQVCALEFLLSKIEQDPRFEDIHDIAYSLATFKWETGHTFQPIVEHGSESYFDRYNGRLGNTQPKDGFRFRGRGYVQLTGRANYAKNGERLSVDLVNKPEMASEPATAYEIAVRGMQEGWFTGKRLSHYIRKGQAPDYANARRIINVMDHAEDIAAIARKMEDVLKTALVVA